MRHSPIAILLTLVSAFALAAAGKKALTVGQVAPDFTLTDIAGRAQTLSAYRGRTVVLEWYDPDCQWDKKQYESELPRIQKSAVEQGVTWFTVISGGQGAHGHMSAAEVLRHAKNLQAMKTIVLLDSENQVAKLYYAKKSLQSFVIDQDGRIVYKGAIDEGNPSKPASIPAQKNFVYDAYRSLMEKQPVLISSTESYGCPL